MQVEQFERSLLASELPAGLSEALQVLWFDGRGDWDAAHGIAQDMPCEAGAWLHAFLHRRGEDLFSGGSPQVVDDVGDGDAGALLGEGGRHLSFHVRQDGVTLRAIAFNKGEMFSRVNPGTHLSVLFFPKLSRWKGRSEIEVEVRDLKLD